jgi:L-amino acid N-acyltransferase YncA
MPLHGCVQLRVNAASVALHTSPGFREVGMLPEAGIKFGNGSDS